MKKIFFILIIFMSTFFISFSQTTKKVTVKPDSIRKDSIYYYETDMKTVKMTDLERKKKEYLEYQRKQQQISKNLDQMDKNIDVLDKQKATMDSVLLKRKIK